MAQYIEICENRTKSIHLAVNLSMICNVLKIFSQNIQKNNLIVNTILETQSAFNIMFIQEPPWLTI